MRIFRRIKKTVGENYFLVLDIGADTVKALVCEDIGEKIKILACAKRRQSAENIQSGLITDIAGVIENAKFAIREAENLTGIHTEKMLLGISGELVKGEVSNISFVRRDPKSKMNLAELKNVVHKVQWRAFDQVRSKIADETGHNEIDIKLVNAHVVNVSIDGYRVSNPIGFQGKELTLSIFNAFAPIEYYGALQTISSELDKELLAIVCEPYALSKTVSSDSRKGPSTIFIDVGAGTTDVSVIRDGIVDGAKMFTIGGRTFTKRISQKLNISFSEAEKIKLLYSQDKLERQSHKIVRNAIKDDSELWLSGLVLTLNEFENEEMNLPSKILLAGSGAKLPEIKESLEGRDWAKALSFIRKPQITTLHPKMITDVIDDQKNLAEYEDVVAMAIARLYLEVSSKEQTLTTLLKKVVRLM